MFNSVKVITDGMIDGNIGMASAAGFYQSIVGFAFVLLANVVVRKLSPENAMF